MKRNLAIALSKLSGSYYHAKSTESHYFQIGCIKVRISDHMSFNTDGDLAIFGNKRGSHYVYAIIPMIGTFKEVQWFYNTKDAIDFIVKYESMARLMLKLPEGYRDKATTAAETDKRKFTDVPLVGKIDKYVWQNHLRFLYICKVNKDIPVLADEIYEHDGTYNTFNKLMNICSLPTEEKEARMRSILAKLVD